MNATRISPTAPICAFSACGRKVKALSLCGGHYWQKSHGQDLRPLAGVALSFEQRFWSKVDKRGKDQCWLWMSATSQGYGRISVGGRGGGMRGAHQVSYELANGELPEGAWVRHSCDTPRCVNPKHLLPGDRASNMMDMRVRERSRTTKLTASKIVEIRARLADGESQRSLAKVYGVSQVNIGRIGRNEIWRHVAAQ